MSDIQVTSVDGSQINVSTGTVIGPLPSLQLAAGSGIDIANAGGVSTISANLAELSIPANLADLSDVSTSSLELGQALTWNGTQWTGANIPVGTTLNGLSGAVTLLAGDGMNVTQEGQNITLASSVNVSNYTTTEYLDERLEGFAPRQSFLRDLTLIQTLDGKQHFLWEQDPLYAGGFTVEIVEVGSTQDIASAGTSSVASDGRISVVVAMDTESLSSLAPAVTSQPEPDTDNRDNAHEDETLISTGSATVWFYLPEQYTTAGTYYVSVTAIDVGGNVIGETDETTVTVAAHGSPKAPQILFVAATSTGFEVAIESDQTPHMRGFYPFEDITYYLEYNTTGDPADSWTRLPGVQAVEGVQAIEIASQQPQPVLWRVVAENPLGEGQALEEEK